jgi:hypothetical protein
MKHSCPLLALNPSTATLNWELHQLDVKTAFLQVDLEEEVFMEQPEGIILPSMRITSAIYSRVYMDLNNPIINGIKS